MLVDVEERQPHEIRVTSRFSHEKAIEEACRRLGVMHQKWPETSWRMKIKRERHPEVKRWWVWGIYCIVPAHD